MVEKNSSSRKKKGSDDLVVAETVKKATLASTKSFDITEEEIRSKKIRMVDAQSKSAKNTRQHLEKFALDPKDGKLVIIEKSLISVAKTEAELLETSKTIQSIATSISVFEKKMTEMTRFATQVDKDMRKDLDALEAKD